MLLHDSQAAALHVLSNTNPWVYVEMLQTQWTFLQTWQTCFQT